METKYRQHVCLLKLNRSKEALAIVSRYTIYFFSSFIYERYNCLA
jgi:hypothetical protein